MVQVIIFFIAFGILLANGAGAIGSFLGALAISFVAGIIFIAIVARKG